MIQMRFSLRCFSRISFAPRLSNAHELQIREENFRGSVDLFDSVG